MADIPCAGPEVLKTYETDCNTFLYFEPKHFDNYLIFYEIQEQILDVQVLVLLGMCCLLTFSYGFE